MDQQQFQWACNQIINQNRERKSIGVLGEKTLHAVVKYYYEPDDMYHEIRKDGYVADIAYGNEVIEIQTRAFNKLRGKLKTFLEKGIVTIVYPIVYEKWIIWIEEETGEVTKRRKSPKRGTVYESFYELYKIKEFLTHPNLRFSFLFLNVEEQRLLNGWSQDKKRGSSRYERIPLELIDEINILRVEDYHKMIPKGLPEIFSTKDYKKCSGLSPRIAGIAVHVLCYVGAIEKVGKKGNLILYKESQYENLSEVQ